MDDKRLLDFYLEVHGQKASPWNLSPESLYLEFRTRDFIKNNVEVTDGLLVCNIGIGAGNWDSFLTYWLGAKGRLTSVDIDKDICDIFEYRQKREKNPNPARVTCADILNNPPPVRAFDLVTIIGVPVRHDEGYEQFLDGAFNALTHKGRLFYWELQKRHSYDQFDAYLSNHPTEPIKIETDDRYPGLAFYMVLVRKK